MTIKTNSGMQSYAYLWIIPADVSGQWRLTTQGGRPRSTPWTSSRSTSRSRAPRPQVERRRRSPSFSVKGDQVSFAVGDGAGRTEFTGKVSDDKASGTAKGTGGSPSWSAVRTKPGERPDTLNAGTWARGCEAMIEARRRGRPGVTDGRGGRAARGAGMDRALGGHPAARSVRGAQRAGVVRGTGGELRREPRSEDRQVRPVRDRGGHPSAQPRGGAGRDGVVHRQSQRAAGEAGSEDPEAHQLPDAGSRQVGDPHTMVLDKAGNAWFTAQGAARGRAAGREERESGCGRRGPEPAVRHRGGRQQRPWYVLFGTNKIATIDPATMKERRSSCPRARGRGGSR